MKITGKILAGFFMPVGFFKTGSHRLGVDASLSFPTSLSPTTLMPPCMSSLATPLWGG